MKARTTSMKRKRRPIDSWYTIEEWIPPENALANVGYWVPIFMTNGRPYREADEVKARECLAAAETGRRFRLVHVKVVAERE